MRDFLIAVDIDAPPERVWQVMSDIERWHEWTASVRSIQRLDDGPLRLGSKAKVRQPRLLPAVFEITSIEDGRAFEWVTRSGGVTAVACHSVERCGDGSRATLGVYFGGPLGGIVGWLLRGLNNRYLAMEAAGLKHRSEQTRGIFKPSVPC
jgi:hypothetical protein